MTRLLLPGDQGQMRANAWLEAAMNNERRSFSAHTDFKFFTTPEQVHQMNLGCMTQSTPAFRLR